MPRKNPSRRKADRQTERLRAILGGTGGRLEMHALTGKAAQSGAKVELPLDRIDLAEGSPHLQLLGGYRHRLWNRP
jgi:hypothetical protein